MEKALFWQSSCWKISTSVLLNSCHFCRNQGICPRHFEQILIFLKPVQAEKLVSLVPWQAGFNQVLPLSEKWRDLSPDRKGRMKVHLRNASWVWLGFVTWSS